MQSLLSEYAITTQLYSLIQLCCSVALQDDTEALPGGPGVLGASHPARPEEGGGCSSDSRRTDALGEHFYRHLQKASPPHTHTVYSFQVGLRSV